MQSANAKWSKMPSSKGKPTDPKLREKVKEEIQNEPNKDGGGKGQWSAWKVRCSFVLPRIEDKRGLVRGCLEVVSSSCPFETCSWRWTYGRLSAQFVSSYAPSASFILTSQRASKLSKEYEKRGGDYENSPGTKNEPQKGTPQPKPSGKKQKEEKKANKEADSPPPDDGGEKQEEEKPKANTAKKASPAAGKKKEKKPVEGTRKSARVAGKRASVGDEGGGEKKKAKR
ncbi:uncharacterized protein N0V89_004333 [Didymosphaeria variabile]|uniref:Uncharacterized protein n=1 Tax=Didymosphaeria variabile TaxID=1932322 RepID=A0A9W8XQ83_9PLEO|nr:uncharacterized protein N0V89_004333 [Didymosphaeria variabile]KAJ4356302.1 hypothetical protein N0V89_004333 [Didymosphaeria variabile]